MPYIKQKDYARAERHPNTPGELNFAITRLLVSFLRMQMDFHDDIILYAKVWALCRDYFLKKGLSYTHGNEIMGVLDCAGREMRRRVAPSLRTRVHEADLILAKVASTVYDEILAPYEDTKIKENGDIYPKELIQG